MGLSQFVVLEQNNEKVIKINSFTPNRNRKWRKERKEWRKKYQISNYQ